MINDLELSAYLQKGHALLFGTAPTETTTRSSVWESATQHCGDREFEAHRVAKNTTLPVTIDRQKFFKGYRESFGSLTQPQVDSLNTLLILIESDKILNEDPRIIAYMIATIKHETADTFAPITERGTASYFSRYDGTTSVGRVLGNTQPGDGARYKGRGYAQITGRANYRRMTQAYRAKMTFEQVDFEANPELMLLPKFSYFAIHHGFLVGAFTGKKITDFINDMKCNYYAARRVINGVDRASLVAGYAETFEKILKSSV